MLAYKKGFLFSGLLACYKEYGMDPVFLLPEQEDLWRRSSWKGLAEDVPLEKWERGAEREGVLLVRVDSLEELEGIGDRLQGGGGPALVWVLPVGLPHLWVRAASLGGEAFVPLESGVQGVLAGIRVCRASLAERSLRLLPFEEAWFSSSPTGEKGGGPASALAKVFHFPGNVGIQGEEGAGVYLLAWALHNLVRPHGPCLVLEGFPFGEREALDLFLGKSSGDKGLLERLREGTLVLTNPWKLPHSAQAALFAWLHRERERNGAGGKAMVRVISVGPQSLASLALEGEFNRGLALLLEERSLHLPPLRERRAEIPALAAAWCARPEKECGLSLSAARALQAHHWPRNAGELKEVLEWAVTRAGKGKTILPMHLPPSFHAAEEGRDREELYLLPRLAPGGTFPKLKEFREQARIQAERVYLLKVLESAGGKVSEARKMAGFSKSTFYALLQKHGFLPPRKKSRE